MKNRYKSLFSSRKGSTRLFSITRVLFYGLLLYVLLFFGWWSNLQYSQMSQLDAANQEILRYKTQMRGDSVAIANLANTPEYQAIGERTKRRKFIIMAGAAVLFMTIMTGFWYIEGGFKREVALANQQRNFLLSITHELKSPIASVRLILETFRKHELSREKTVQFADRSLKELERLNKLVNNILLAAKVENTNPWHEERLEMNELVNGVMEQVRSKFPNVRFSSRFDGDTNYVMADRTAITTIAFNLVENAVKYSSPENTEIQTIVRQKKGRVFFKVADNGIGIPDEDKGKIFDKFYRVGSEDTRKTKGTGLGLYIVKQIVKAHNGSIVVRNNSPQGSVFEVTLPIAS